MIVMHHVGGKNATYPFPVKKGKLLSDISLVLYDADPNCLEHMNLEAAKGPFNKLTILPYLIGKQAENLQFNLTVHSTNSSIYEFNPEFSDFHAVNYPRYGEYRFGNGFEIAKRAVLQSYSLEQALKKENVKAIDVLTLDVQGAEFDIITESKDLIKEETLCVQLEVEFVELYKNQKSFSDLHKLLQPLDFMLVDLHSIGRASPCSLPIGFRGEELLMWGEAVYLKSFSSMQRETNIDKIVKWTFFAFVYKQMGLCLQGLKLLEEKSYFANPRSSHFNYEQMIEKIWKIYKNEGSLSLPKFHELFTRPMIENFYKVAAEKLDCSEDQKKVDQSFSKSYGSYYALAKELASKQTTALEELCIEYDLEEVGAVLKKNRIRDAGFFVGLCQSHLKE